MVSLRKEITDYSRSCEHLISAAVGPAAVPFTQDEIDWITYYTEEMTNLVDQLVRKSKTQVNHDRQALHAFSIASEALFLTNDLEDRERDSIRQSVSDVTTKILHDKKDSAL